MYSRVAYAVVAASNAQLRGHLHLAGFRRLGMFGLRRRRFLRYRAPLLLEDTGDSSGDGVAQQHLKPAFDCHMLLCWWLVTEDELVHQLPATCLQTAHSFATWRHQMLLIQSLDSQELYPIQLLQQPTEFIPLDLQWRHKSYKDSYPAKPSVLRQQTTPAATLPSFLPQHFHGCGCTGQAGSYGMRFLPFWNCSTSSGFVRSVRSTSI